MIPSITVTESKGTEIDISEDHARRLNELGRRLASKSTWWGADSEEAQENQSEKSVIRCDPTRDGRWRLTVKDAVGLVSVGDLQIHVLPKIPQAHLLFLWSKSGHFPALEDFAGSIAVGANLWHLIADWFVTAAEQVLRRDLIRDYSEVSGALRTKRGKLKVLGTARAYYAGRLELHCEYEEFGADTPLNRLLLEATKIVLRGPNVEFGLRRRAWAIRARMEDIGELEATDLRATPDRRSYHYTDAITLAKHLIRSVGRDLGKGTASAWTFLIRTPEMVEEGVRNVLKEKLSGRWGVEKRGVQIVGSAMTLNPDLVFNGGLAIGDVKYKLLHSNWVRPDLYQLTTFVTGSRSYFGAIVGFQTDDRDLPPTVKIGPINLSCLAWSAREDVAPIESAEQLSDDVAEWLEKVEMQAPESVDTTQAGVSGGLNKSGSILAFPV